MNRQTLKRDLENMMIGKISFNEKLVTGALIEILNTLDILEKKLEDKDGKEK